MSNVTYSCSRPEAPEPVVDATPKVVAKTVKSAVRYGQANTVSVSVTADSAAAPGTVDVALHGKTIARNVKLSHGKATVALPRTTRPGSWTLTLKYSGAAGVKAGTASTKVRVVKSAPTVSAKLSDSSITTTRTGKVAVSVRLPGASGVYATGTVRIVEGKKTLKTVTLSSKAKGRTTITLPKLKKGTHKIRVVLLSNSLQGEAKSKQLKLRVR